MEAACSWAVNSPSSVGTVEEGFHISWSDFTPLFMRNRQWQESPYDGHVGKFLVLMSTEIEGKKEFFFLQQ